MMHDDNVHREQFYGRFYATGTARKAQERWPSASEKAKKKGDHVLNATSREVTPSRETQLSRDFYGEVAAAPAKRHTRLFQLNEFLVHVLHRLNNSVIPFIPLYLFSRFFLSNVLSFFFFLSSIKNSVVRHRCLI